MKKRIFSLLLSVLFFLNATSCSITTDTHLASSELSSIYIEPSSEEITSNIKVESLEESSSKEQLKPGMTDKRTPEEIPTPTVSLSNLMSDEQVVYEYDLIFPLENSYLSYPQFKYIKNNALTEKINAMIFEKIGKDILSENSTDLDFEVTFSNDKFLSMVFKVSTIRPTIFTYSFNFDLSTGENLELTSLFMTDSSFWEITLDKGRILKWRYESDDFYDVTYDFIIENSSLPEETSFYVYDDFLILNVTTLHAMGDYMSFIINLEDVIDHTLSDTN